jgi:phosphatidylserine/phosphatidylglycerophosphate/cardiolipin synthase-like enzyme
MNFTQFTKRIRDDEATLYVVTRPPTEPWHRDAVEQLATARTVSVRLLPALHTKLYWASTAQGDFALIGSANLTQRSLANREIGVLIRAVGEGTPIVGRLAYEAAEIYRTPGSTRFPTPTRTPR